MSQALQLLHFIAGMLFLMFIPGCMASLVFFKKLGILERIAVAIGLSIVIDVLIGFVLGLNKFFAQMTGGITEVSVWICLVSVSLIFALVYILRRKSGK